MPGMNRATGQSIDGLEHIRQSIADILTTPIGSRVMRREYGSLIPSLIDQPTNDALMLQVYSAAVMAIIRWEPRVTIQSIRRSVSTTQPGTATLAIEATTNDGESVTLEAPLQ
ncbi:GPW/gp25 family protein [Salinicola sp. LHM]|uniref:GPW/gp25 family protein n=1 Tax=Salinicola sp. LHM TaxID=3065298 RepID=UPI002ACDF6FE|nr:GPW/gp25 family protein [Salinicola sp. LHM]WQH33370.1 GPW/gp25 family protein [Salinicola sp. LHM]